MFGFETNKSKCKVLTHPWNRTHANKVFKLTGLDVINDGAVILGSPIGIPQFEESFVNTKTQKWEDMIERLRQVAESDVQLAYSALTHSMQFKWTHLLRTVDINASLLKPLRQQIFQKLIPSIIGTKIISKEAEHISSLPLRKGCLGVVDPYHIAGTEYANSYAMCTPLIDFNQASDLTITQDAIRKGIGAAREQMYEEELRELHDQTNGKWKHLLQYASGRGASSWLSGNRLKALDVV
ncbi:hypothetical protein GJ496_011212 [Pomphorhynchus laevis]|nr:hypothetical protein GJ496_011212 [Pomphorhynchus laevis]